MGTTHDHVHAAPETCVSNSIGRALTYCLVFLVWWV